MNKMFRSKKRLLALGLTAVISLSSATALYASPVIKTLRAQYMGIKFSYNGKIVDPGNQEPFVVDQTTYVPIRMVGELVGKNVQWDGINKLISINDTVDQTLAQKDLEIIQLKEEIESLKQQLEAAKKQTPPTQTEDKNTSKISLSNLEDDINEDYGELKGVVFDIYLSGDSKEIEIEMETDLYRYKDYWDKLSEKDVEKHLEKICKAIWEVYDKAKIVGDLYDIDEREYVLEFSTDSRKKLTVEYVNKLDLSKLEYELDNRYDHYLPYIYLSLDIKGDEEEIEYYLNVDYSYYHYEWDDLDDEQVKTLMGKIYDDIKKAAPNATSIEGYIYDTSRKSVIAEYWRTKSGNAVFLPYY